MNKKFKIKGMHCKSCEMLIQESLEDIGVKVKSISHTDGTINIDYDEKKMNEIQIMDVIKKEGYKVV
jgi:copper chaperone CopZ